MIEVLFGGKRLRERVHQYIRKISAIGAVHVVHTDHIALFGFFCIERLGRFDIMVGSVTICSDRLYCPCVRAACFNVVSASGEREWV